MPDMPNILLFLFLCCLVMQPCLASFVNERTSTCRNESTVKGHTLLVQHGEPLSGKVLIIATVLPSIHDISMCKWTFTVGSTTKIEDCDPDVTETLKEGTLTWKFGSQPGLKELTVAAIFYVNDTKQSLRNCTFVNVQDCSRQLQLAVSTSKGSFNMSRNHSTLILDSPGMVNFTILVFNIEDPWHICYPLYYKWSFGDGQYLLNTRDNNVDHFYKTSGLFRMVLDIFKDKDEKMFYKNISITVHVKEKPSSHGNTNTGINVTLVVAILLTVVVLLGCLVIFRRKVHRFTEVARFDFREDFPNTTPTLYYKQGGCFRRLFPGRREGDEHLLGDDPYSTRQSFGSTLPNDEY